MVHENEYQGVQKPCFGTFQYLPNMNDLGRPPYFSEDFFLAIREVYEDKPTTIGRMTTKEWYSVFLERNLTKWTDIFRFKITKLCKRKREMPSHKRYEW